MNNRTYIICNLSDSNLVLFSQVNQSSAQSVRRNLANTQMVLSYQVEPSFITDGSLTPLGTYNHSEILEILAGSDWSEPMPEE
tara:strand:- start:11077 stop:11325 length:249 start_codon:yes stop_codon:yes gene_type:complete